MMRGMKNRALILAALVATALAAAPAARAADKTAKEGTPAGKGGGAFLTKEQLRACMTQKAHAAQLDDDLGREQTALAAAKDEVGRSGETLKAQLETIDRTSAEAVAAYNEQAQARDRQIDAYQARVTAFNARVEAAKVEREAYGKSCENRRFFEEDEIAIKKGK